ncbi:MAG: hypothetical protein QOH75_1494 [Actinomycetota bacterium]|nr:hypothetical protein [Actinomycetota bacterium]
MHDNHAAACLQVLTEIGQLGPLRRELVKSVEPTLHSGAAGVLWHLAEQGPMRMRDLAGVLQVDASVASRQVAELAAAGHVERQRDPADGRACLLTLTPSGHSSLADAVDRVVSRFERHLEAWDPDHLQRLATDLRRLREDLSDLLPA